MKLKAILIVILTVVAFGANAQTEGDGGRTLSEDSLRLDMKMLRTDSLLMDRDSSLLLRPMQPMSVSDAATKLNFDPRLLDSRRGSWEVGTILGGKLFTPWRGAALVVSGGANSMPGLLDRESGNLTLYQNLGRWTFSASALADKYRFIGMGFLQTRYGVGGTVGYYVNPVLSLHAFGYYYFDSSVISPAVNPFLSTNTYGGYADIRMHKNFGVDAGVRRYLNPMTGQWVTEPIVSPYLRLNNGQKFGFDFGGILKELIWGNKDQMMPMGPVRMPPQAPRR